MPTWTINGLPLSHYGVTVARRVQKNLLSDDVTLVISRRQVSPPFAFEEFITLELDGLPWFRGWVTSLPDSVSPSEEETTITVSGPHYWLDQILFGREYATFGGIAESFSLGLFLGTSFPRVTLASQLGEVLAWAARKSGNKFTASVESVPEITPPPRMIADMTCGEVLRECLAWMPDAALHVDYSSPVPAMVIRPFRACATVLQNLGTAPFQTASLERQQGVGGVHLRYNAGDSLRYVDHTGLVDAYPPGISGGGASVLSVTLSMEDYIPGQSIARVLYDSFSSVAWQARLSFSSRELISLSPGDRVSVENAPPHWSGHELHLTVIDQDIAHGHASALCNSRAHLGVRDLIDLARPFRRSLRSTTEEQLPAPDHPFCPYLVKSLGRYWLRFAPGTIRGYNQDIVPTWNGTPLDASSPPFTPFFPGFRQEFWIKVEFLPDAQEFDLSYEDTSGEPVAVTWWRFVSSGTVRSATVVTKEAPARLPFCSQDGATRTPGTYFFKLATPTNRERLRWDRVDFEANAYISNSFGLIFHPPKTLQRYS